MKAWNQDPRKFLLMNLKLAKGIQFSNPLGEILATIPNQTEPTVIAKWQYRMMLSLDGEQQFVEVVKDVKNECDGEFEATDVWMFLDWLIENDLIEEAELEYEPESETKAPVLPELVEPAKSTRTWLKVPLQIFGALLICAGAAFGAYSATPILLALFQDEVVTPVEEVIAEVSTPVVEEISTAVRTPKLVEPDEVTFASRAPAKEELPPVPEEPSLVDKLISMRREVAACQIRRDEYYLLNNENGYRAEVAKISELVKEIGKIRAEITE